MLLINKPPGPTSHDIVDEVRKITGIKKVGHAGTLDPFAEGLLIVLVGREETKKQAEFMALNKVYEAMLTLGAETDTFDITGKIQETRYKIQTNSKLQIPNIEDIKETLKNFEGEQDQMPPIYSAKKIKGKKAYELARKGEVPELKPKRVKIYEIKILNYNYPELKIKTKVSSGTYIRALARDIGRELGVGAYVSELRRTEIGKYKLEDAQTIEGLK
ncbi:MAG: tRNA pseudouridine(55) synthase TruB, partial [Candidatus Spechtbacterales bacterium]